MSIRRSISGVYFLLIACLMFGGCNREPQPIIESVPRNDSLRFSSQPIAQQEVFELTRKPLSQNEQMVRVFEAQLAQLSKYADTVRMGAGTKVVPPIFADQFETSFLEREKLQSAYLGERIRIARWRLSEKTPTFYESIAVNRLFETTLEPWKDAENFRIEFAIHTVRNRPNYFDVEVMVDISGFPPGNGNNSISRSAVGVWQIIWLKASDDDPPRIKKINMFGHEETIAYVAGGSLFEDCTQSILRNDEELVETIAFGLDAWAKRIPGLDVLGNNGLAIGDVNNDGLDDVYVCQPHGIGNLLLVQNPDGTADNIAATAGVDIRDNSVSSLLVDLDNNRLQDLVVVTDSHLVLYSNSGNGTFQKEHALRIGVGTESVSAVDYDVDGDLDLFLTKYRPVSRFDDFFAQPNSRMNAINGGRNILLSNEEAWNFKDVTSEVGLSYSNQNYSRAAVWNDYDSDGDLDLYLANEYFQDILFRNDSGWFSEANKDFFSTHATNSTTVSTGDFNHDGKVDFFVGADASFTSKRITQNYIDAGGKHLRDAKGFGSENRLYYEDVDGNIEQWPFRSPIFSSESTFSSVVADFNNDSWEDIATTNGMLTRRQKEKAEFVYYRNLFDPDKDLAVAKSNSYELSHEVSELCRQGESFNGEQRNRCFLGIGAMRFANFSNSSGLDFLDDSRAIACTDWDGDGDIDLLLTNRTAPRFRVLRNSYDSRNQFIKFRLAGTKSNRDAIGSRVEVFLRGADQPLVKTLVAGSGRISQSSKELHFGLGKGISIERVDVYWPSQEKQSFENVKAGKTYRIVEGSDEPAELANDRYRIAIDGTAIKEKKGVPSADRIKFFPTTRLPILQYRGSSESVKQKWYQIENVEQRPLFVILCPYESDVKSLLRDWNIRERNFAKMKSDLLVVFTGWDRDPDFEVKKATAQIDEIGFKFRWGVMSASSNTKLEMVFGQWFFDLGLPQEPMGLLLDGGGNVHFAYEGDMLTWDRVSNDLNNLADKNFVLNQVQDSDNETWVNHRRTPRYDRLKRRFEEIGFVRDVSALEPLVDMQHAEDYINRSIDLASDGKILAALSAAEKSMEIDPESIDAQINLADTYRQFANTADQQARTRMLRTAGELLDKAIAKEPANEEAILARAEIFRLQQDVENALNLLGRYLTINPESWQVHAIIGRLFFHKREYFEATKYLITAIENRPTLPYVASDLGYLYLLNKQFSDSREYLELAIRLQPSDINLKRYLAEAEFWNGNFEKAGLLFKAAVELQPTLSHPKIMLAWLKGCSPFANFRNGQEGIDLIEPFVERRGSQSPSVLETMAICLAEKGDFDGALSVQRQALEAIDSNASLEKYNEKQIKALQDRLELYKRKRTYRISNPAEAPMKLLGEH